MTQGSGLAAYLFSTGPRALAAAIGLGVALKFLKWFIEFVFRRLDVNRSQLGKRLEHVEIELDAYREAAMMLLGVVAKIDPMNPALAKVAEILRKTSPRPRMGMDELVERLSEIPGTKGG